MLRLTSLAAVSLSFSALAATPLASPEVVEQLQAMNEADCLASKAGNFEAYLKTLAPEYVQVTADGTRASRAQVVADRAQSPAGDKVTACSTQVDKVTHVGAFYYVYGTYKQEGVDSSTQAVYHLTERMRDTWRRGAGVWLQVESRGYEMTLEENGRTRHIGTAGAGK